MNASAGSLADKRSASLAPPPIPFMLAGIAIPGFGHVLHKRYAHAAVFALCVYGLFWLGEGLANFSAIDQHNHPIYFLLQMLSGVQAWAMEFGGLENEALLGDSVGIREHSIGISFCAIAGVLNLLSVLELAKHAPSRKLPSSTTQASTDDADA